MSPVLCVQVSILLRSFPYTNIDMVLCHGKNRPVARTEVKRLSMHSVMQNVCFLSVQLMMTTAAPYLRWLCMVLCALRRPRERQAAVLLRLGRLVRSRQGE